jgi:hypothetical protein
MGRIQCVNADFGISRDESWRVLTDQGIPCTPVLPSSALLHPVYQNGGAPFRVEPCLVVEGCVREAFWLPRRILLADSDAMLK